MVTLSLLVCLNARSLLSDMIGADPNFFHSHMKRQPLTNFLGQQPSIPNHSGPFSPGVGGIGKGRSLVDLGLGRGEGRRFDVRIDRTVEEEEFHEGAAANDGRSEEGSTSLEEKVLPEYYHQYPMTQSSSRGLGSDGKVGGFEEEIESNSTIVTNRSVF